MKIGLLGRGRLGTAIASAAGPGISWQAGRGPVPDAPVDVLIDVSAASAVEEHLDLALERKTPLVIGSTGWQLPDLAERVGDRIGVLTAPNFSLTVAFVRRLTAILGAFAELDPAADPYLVEHHQARKQDAPSGTARLLAETLLASCDKKSSWTLPPTDAPLRPDQLCISVLRAGHTASSHVVGVDMPGEVLEVVHTARDLSPYAAGALRAARFLMPRCGLFSMEDVARDSLDPLFEGMTAGSRT